jgi:C-terminal processing protease CtpA/Prc
MKKILTILILIISVSCNAQTSKFNLDFEGVKNSLPVNWENFGSDDYLISIDTTVSQHGNNSAVIEYQGDVPQFKAWSYSIPANYRGKKIKLSGYLKTENVTNGYAGLWMRIDPSVAFDNMKDRGVTGTTDWEKYEIVLDLQASSARRILVGGLLVGKGKMWIDNLKVTIDGKPLAKVHPKKISKAERDTEFYLGSKVVIGELDEQQISNLELLGKIWGFLKYHHPAVGKGDYNWDYELFRILPDYLKATGDGRDQVLTEWIEKYGDIPHCKSCKATADDAFLKPDLAWIEDSNLSSSLKEKLKYIKQNRHQGEHYYIAMASQVGNPKFKNEDSYLNMPYPDAGFRLLALYKYWNMIHYFFPYKKLMDKDWNKVLKEYIPKFINAKTELEYEFAAVQLIGDIQDTHANLWGGNNAINKWKGENYAPVHVRFIENKLVVTDYYNPELQEKTGLKVGDVITKIDGENVEDIVQRKLPFYPASNYPTQLRNLSGDILRSNSESISINYLRDKKEYAADLQLYARTKLNIYRWYRRDDQGKCFKMLEDNIGYITLKNIKQEDVKKIKEQFKDTKGIIVDIRNYPSAFVPFSLGSFFISDRSSFVKFTQGNDNNPGEFTFTKPFKIPSQSKSYKNKVVVLVNELTQSQAEYTAMAFKAGDNTTVIGSTTAGADGNVSKILLPGGLSTKISGIGVYYPDGTETQRIGIVPDIEVHPTIKGIREGRDELLEKAVEFIKE